MDPTTEFLRFLVKVTLIFAAAISPVILGDKISKAISGKIGDWTKSMRKSRMARSRAGGALAARRKFKEGEAFNKGLAGIARSRFTSPENKAAATAMLDRAHKDRAERMSKDGKNEFLEKRGYTKLGDDGKVHFVNRGAFDKDYLAQAVVRAQSDSGLFNDDVTDKLTYLNEMRSHQMAQGDSAMIVSNSKNGGYDLVSDETLSANAGATLGQLTSAVGRFRNPEDAAGVGSEWADRFMQNYHGVNVNKTYKWIDKDGINRTANGYAIKHGLNHRLAEVTASGVKITDDKMKGFNSLDGIVKGSFAPGDIEKLFQSDTSGRKAMKIFSHSGTKGYEGSSGVPGGSRVGIETAKGNIIGDDGFIGLLGRVNPGAARQAKAALEYHKETGRVAMPTAEKGGEPHELTNPRTGRPFGS